MRAAAHLDVVVEVAGEFGAALAGRAAGAAPGAEQDAVANHVAEDEIGRALGRFEIAFLAQRLVAAGER